MIDLIVNELLEHLSDGQWHDIFEVDEAMPVPTWKILETLEFLCKYNIVEVQRNAEGSILLVRLTEPTFKWYGKISRG